MCSMCWLTPIYVVSWCRHRRRCHHHHYHCHWYHSSLLFVSMPRRSNDSIDDDDCFRQWNFHCESIMVDVTVFSETIAGNNALYCRCDDNRQCRRPKTFSQTIQFYCLLTIRAAAAVVAITVLCWPDNIEKENISIVLFFFLFPSHWTEFICNFILNIWPINNEMNSLILYGEQHIPNGKYKSYAGSTTLFGASQQTLNIFI